MIEAIILLAGLGIFFGIVLSLASRFLLEKDNPLVKQVRQVLPGLDCAACGYAGCQQFAEAIVKEDIEARCGPGGSEVMKKINRILGRDKQCEPSIAKVKCQGGSREKHSYEGIPTCKAAKLTGSPKSCPVGCIGFGDCIIACKFDAIKGIPPKIDTDKCNACGACQRACPNNIIHIEPKKRKVHIACSSTDKDKAKYCTNSCIACGICEKVCPKQAIKIKDNLPVIDYDKCVGCGLCAKKCPRKVIIHDDE